MTNRIPYLLAGLLLAGCQGNETKDFVTKDGYSVRVVEDARGDVAQKGDVVRLRMTTQLIGPKDSLLFKTDAQSPFVEMLLVEPSYPGDLNFALRMLSAGDSAIFRQNVDTFYAKGLKTRRIEAFPAGSTFEHSVRVVSIRNPENEIADFAKKELAGTPARPSGVYIQLQKPGSGPVIEEGDKVVVSYQAHVLGGTKFEESAGKEMIVGQNVMIEGMEIAVQSLQAGSEVRALIPHYLAYGSQQPRPGLPSYANIDLRLKVLRMEKNATAKVK